MQMSATKAGKNVLFFGTTNIMLLIKVNVLQDLAEWGFCAYVYMLKLKFSVNTQPQSVAPRPVCSSLQVTWDAQE